MHSDLYLLISKYYFRISKNHRTFELEEFSKGFIGFISSCAENEPQRNKVTCLKSYPRSGTKSLMSLRVFPNSGKLHPQLTSELSMRDSKPEQPN